MDLVDDPDRGWTSRRHPPSYRRASSIRAYRASDARGVHRVIDAAFTEWEGRDPEPYEVWAPQIIAHPAFRPELSPLAFDGDEIVGAVISYDYPEPARAGSSSSRRRRPTGGGGSPRRCC